MKNKTKSENIEDNMDNNVTKPIEKEPKEELKVVTISDNATDKGERQVVTERAKRIIDTIEKRVQELLAWENHLKDENKRIVDLAKTVEEQTVELNGLTAIKETLLQREKNLQQREKTLENREKEMQSRYEKRFAELEEKLVNWSNEKAAQQEKLDQEKELLVCRENAVQEKEITWNASFAQQQAEATKQLLQKKQDSIDQFKNWANEQNTTLQNNLMNLLKTYEESLSTMRKESFDTSKAILEKEREHILNDINRELERKKEELSKLQKQIEEEKIKIESEKQKLQVAQTRIIQKEETIDEIVDIKQRDKLKALQDELDESKNANKELLIKIGEKNKLISEFEQMQAEFGDRPFEVMNKCIKDLTKENSDLKEQLSNELSKSEIVRLKAYEDETKSTLDKYKEINIKNLRLEQELAEQGEKETKIVYLNRKVKNLETDKRELEADNSSLRERIKRLLTDDGRMAERDERIRSIEKCLDNVKGADSQDEAIDEKKWLDNIGSLCFRYGFHFPNRILYAFHTALKIADWSTITVLAGVSGTGKSELPHLYARFGGLNFISVPVQPNWDSQESMLGFFNSIDNKFDAQPLLRFLAQCSNSKDLGMLNSLNIVLLDEMNLAHVEHYFAEFLSKLEMRRDYNDSDVPKININIGAGMEPYELKLTRNILWTGTMNQDETTKSLSDKVLDRGLIIHFPRPKELVSRTKGNLADFLKQHEQEVKMLNYNVWRDQWVKTPDFQGKQRDVINGYKTIIQKINEHLSKAGRSLGHRVWQSIEYYVANYPTVIEEQRRLGDQEKNSLNLIDTSKALEDAMCTAFEDQLVQKVMPKLRGIETTGPVSVECLDPIQRLLEAEGFRLGNDFRNARQYGYGQFIWNSADFIDDKDIAGENNEDNNDIIENDEV